MNSNCESVGCGLQPNRSKPVNYLKELDIKEHVKNVQNSPETVGQASYKAGSQEMTTHGHLPEMTCQEMKTAGRFIHKENCV